ncbi:MAG: DUF3857 domain-containing protein, partial [Ginsengibacter sp.]
MRTILFSIIIFLSVSVVAQKKSPFEKFGDINTSDLNKKTYNLDTSADAVVLSDIGNVSIIGVDGWFSLVTKRHTVIHILKKKGYDLANVKLSLYKEGDDEERVKSLRGVTYNLENGKLVSTKLEKSGQFKEKLDKNSQLLKFTLPKVKEGSIIEYDYELTSPFITVPDSWYFQRLDAPVLWSEYSFGSPGFFGYHFFPRGYQPFFINEVPDGYMIDDLPKSFRINYDKAGGASFDYLISESENIISFRGTLKINKTNFP